ncbi:MAG: aldo/keto reductase [Candidatus Marinimicrobia bacterium]|jgi:predicted oxidoreductase|nr:aldo/keto reductase [Candidatus Neomarinimicrobiota bacterium]MDX9778119.1 aldo/keto reductase [bacterium]
MKLLPLPGTKLPVSAIILGCMRIAKMPVKDVSRLLNTARDAGINFFDHADIYGTGKSEEVFAAALDLTATQREEIYIQTKCGIRKGFYDYSKAHILASVDASLERLKTDYVDTLLLHRPDTLMEPEEVAEAFELLEASGKVRHFGVSNHNPGQIELLQKYLKQPLIINQLQFSITNSGMVDRGINVNMENPASVDHDGGILEYCRLKNIRIQPWSPFLFGFFDGVFLDHPKFPVLNATLERMAKENDITKEALVIAWILRHPAKMQPVVGTTNPERLKNICKASDISLTRPEWYEIYRAAGKQLP